MPESPWKSPIRTCPAVDLDPEPKHPGNTPLGNFSIFSSTNFPLLIPSEDFFNQKTPTLLIHVPSNSPVNKSALEYLPLKSVREVKIRCYIGYLPWLEKSTPRTMIHGMTASFAGVLSYVFRSGLNSSDLPVLCFLFRVEIEWRFCSGTRTS